MRKKIGSTGILELWRKGVVCAFSGDGFAREAGEEDGSFLERWRGYMLAQGWLFTQNVRRNHFEIRKSELVEVVQNEALRRNLVGDGIIFFEEGALGDASLMVFVEWDNYSNMLAACAEMDATVTD